jgi:glycolate oxidase
VGLQELVAEVRRLLPRDAVITDRERLRTYECDGLAYYRVCPGLVVLPETVDQLAAVVSACARHRVPFVARGSGTGLSAGALPLAEGALIVTSKLRAVLEVDLDNERVSVQPGVTNLAVTRAVAADGYYYAPDPSSQQVCSIGGNVAENSGGAHCLKYGFTTHHVTGLDIVLADGRTASLGGKAVEHPGYDLVGAVVGSEGTLGIVTSVTVRVLPAPETVRTMLAGFHDIDTAGGAVSDIIAAGVLPAAIEMMDAEAISAVEEAVGCGYPPGAAAVLIVELDGPLAEVDAQFDEVVALCRASGAFEVRLAADETERALIWKGRKSAFGAMGRISRNYIVQDGVIPRTALPEVLRRIKELSRSHGIRVANVFHAGDGNLHPLVLFDESVPGETERAEAVSKAILALCIEFGGSITGEHGVGADKVAHMPDMFSADDLDTMQRLRCAFDPDGQCNPGKVFPTPRLCGEAPGPRSGVHPLLGGGRGGAAPPPPPAAVSSSGAGRRSWTGAGPRPPPTPCST